MKGEGSIQLKETCSDGEGLMIDTRYCLARPLTIPSSLSLMTSLIPIPPPLKAFFAHFPLYTHPAIQTRERENCSKSPTLWIHPPFDPSSNFLSSDIECLKWQAYIALRGLSNISVRWDLSADAGIDGHLPNLCTYSESVGDYELLDRKMIPGWVDTQVPVDVLDGFNDEEAKLESEAWISLLEGIVHAAVVRKNMLRFSMCPDPFADSGTAAEAPAQQAHFSLLPNAHTFPQRSFCSTSRSFQWLELDFTPVRNSGRRVRRLHRVQERGSGPL